MTDVKYWRSFGLPLSAWRLLDLAKSNPVFQELYPGGSDSEALSWLLRLGSGRAEVLQDKELVRE